MLVDLFEFSCACPCYPALKRFLSIFRVHVPGPNLLKTTESTNVDAARKVLTTINHQPNGHGCPRSWADVH